MVWTACQSTRHSLLLSNCIWCLLSLKLSSNLLDNLIGLWSVGSTNASACLINNNSFIIVNDKTLCNSPEVFKGSQNNLLQASVFVYLGHTGTLLGDFEVSDIVLTIKSSIIPLRTQE